MAKSAKQQAIEKHHGILEALRKECLKKCDDLTKDIKEKLAKVRPEDVQTRQALLNEQQSRLNEILHDLNNQIAKANKDLIEIVESEEKETNEEAMDKLLKKI